MGFRGMTRRGFLQGATLGSATTLAVGHPRGSEGLVYAQTSDFDEFEDEEPCTLVFFESVYRSNVRMVQRSQKFGFTFKPCQPFIVLGEFFRQGLDGYFATEFGVPRTPHLAHAALSKGRNDFVVRELRAGFDHP